MTEIDARELRLLKKAYGISHQALNEIKELIAMHDIHADVDVDKLIDKINDVAAEASQVDLLNPHRIESSRDLIEAMEYEEPQPSI